MYRVPDRQVPGHPEAQRCTPVAGLIYSDAYSQSVTCSTTITSGEPDPSVRKMNPT